MTRTGMAKEERLTKGISRVHISHMMIPTIETFNIADERYEWHGVW